MDPVKVELEGVLRYHEVLWSKILESNHVDHIEIATAASDVRGKLNNAMGAASTMFESNMQCFTHILALQKEKADMMTQHQSEVQELQGRLSSLMDIVVAQQNQVESSSSLLQLKATWAKIIEANISHTNTKSLDKISTEDTSTALALLSAVFATEASQSGSNGQSIIHQLLNKLTAFETQLISETQSYRSENELLRQKLQEKSAKLHDTTKTLFVTQAEEDKRKENMNKLDGYTRSLQSKIDILEAQNAAQRNQITELEAALSQSQQSYSELSKQYDEAVDIAELWRATCQKYEQIMEKNEAQANQIEIQANIDKEKADREDTLREADEILAMSPSNRKNTQHYQDNSDYDDDDDVSIFESKRHEKEYLSNQRSHENLSSLPVRGQDAMIHVLEDQLHPRASSFATPRRRYQSEEFYSPQSSPSVSQIFPHDASDLYASSVLNAPLPAMSYQDSFRTLDELAEESPNQEIPPEPIPQNLPQYDRNKTVHKSMDRAPFSTPSPMTDRSFSTNPSTSQHRHITRSKNAIIPTTSISNPIASDGQNNSRVDKLSYHQSNINNIYNDRYASNNFEGVYQDDGNKSQGYISTATRKSMQRKYDANVGYNNSQIRKSVNDAAPIQHRQKRTDIPSNMSSSYPKSSTNYHDIHDGTRILRGDISMNSSMERDVSNAVKMISAMMPWDD